MRDHQLQTPQKDRAAAYRRPKPAADRHKKSQKPSQKNLSQEFAAHAEDALGFGSQKDSIDVSSIVEKSEDNLLDDSSESQDSSDLMTPASSTTTSSISRVEESPLSVQFRPSVSSAQTDESASLMTPASSTITSEAIASSDVSPLTSTITSDGWKSGTCSNSKVRIFKEQGVSSSSVEVEVVLKSLRAAQLQVSKAKNMDLQSKKILNALVNIVVEDIIQLPVERDTIDELMSKKGYLVLLLVITWALAVFAFLLNSSRGIISSTGAVPT